MVGGGARASRCIDARGAEPREFIVAGLMDEGSKGGSGAAIGGGIDVVRCRRGGGRDEHFPETQFD